MRGRSNSGAKHNIVVADEGNRGVWNHWIPRCSCGWEGHFGTEDEADAEGAKHRQACHPGNSGAKP